jgi:hypothetical protein
MVTLPELAGAAVAPVEAAALGLAAALAGAAEPAAADVAVLGLAAALAGEDAGAAEDGAEAELPQADRSISAAVAKPSKRFTGAIVNWAAWEPSPCPLPLRQERVKDAG